MSKIAGLSKKIKKLTIIVSWRARRDSNPQPADPQSDILPIELRTRYIEAKNGMKLKEQLLLSNYLSKHK